MHTFRSAALLCTRRKKGKNSEHSRSRYSTCRRILSLEKMERSLFVAMMVAAAAVATLMAEEADAALDTEVVHFAGQVLCQDCTKRWTEWIHGDPIEGARVAVTCLDSRRRRVVYHASGTTDGAGEFDFPISIYPGGSTKATIKPAEDCTVRVVASPDATCNIMTDFGGGQRGVKPDQRSALHPAGVVKYTLGPFFFTSLACEEAEIRDDGSSMKLSAA
ncbi:pistil-specific extensin-like protein [Canna indica]|uniref:Pistil-specific extensin-like protein n=1 Tax=Canna indica TaxID=4628 RepID=A0AAQ3K3U9_9LILI|nr:pistil-specific extensin-like protein [Canna indica]